MARETKAQRQARVLGEQQQPEDTTMNEEENTTGNTVEEKPKAVRTIVGNPVDLSHYEKTVVKGEDGKVIAHKIDIGDEVAVLLRDKTLDEVYNIAAEVVNVTVESLKEKYKHLNAGQQRMNLGNRIRNWPKLQAKAEAKAAAKAAREAAKRAKEQTEEAA
jgi:hypothetical protein